jgi:hypothetical protein
MSPKKGNQLTMNTDPDLSAEHHESAPAPADPPVDTPELGKTAGDYRKEDAEADSDQLQDGKAGIQKAAHDKALQQYAAEQLKKYPPTASDPLKDRDARLAEKKRKQA